MIFVRVSMPQLENFVFTQQIRICSTSCRETGCQGWEKNKPVCWQAWTWRSASKKDVYWEESPLNTLPPHSPTHYSPTAHTPLSHSSPPLTPLTHHHPFTPFTHPLTHSLTHSPLPLHPTLTQYHCCFLLSESEMWMLDFLAILQLLQLLHSLGSVADMCMLLLFLVVAVVCCSCSALANLRLKLALVSKAQRVYTHIVHYVCPCTVTLHGTFPVLLLYRTCYIPCTPIQRSNHGEAQES